jgi:hypothetical protein
MAKEHQPGGRAAAGTSAGDPTRQSSLDEATKFAETLKRRGEAARGLEKDLLTDVPLLYGSPGSLEPRGDPGIILAQIHREELVRRNRGGITSFPGGESPATLPFERATVALVILLAIVFFSGLLS